MESFKIIMSDQASTGNRKLDSLRDRAAAKIIWGEDEDSVYRFLRNEGVASEMADQFIDAANRERAARIRQKSLIRMIIGLVGALICGGLLFGLVGLNREYGPDDSGGAVRYSGRAVALLLLGLIVFGGYALKQLFTIISGRSLGSAMEDGT